jgi:long-subunit fatty acid transport protein
MYRILSLTLLCFFLVADAWGQTFDNALRLSTLEHTGTARNMGVGSAMLALGADYSSSTYNPAGLALIRRSELVFTPVLYNAEVDSRWGSQQNNDRFSNLQFNNIGLVLASQPQNSTKLTNFTFAFGFNRLASFHQNVFSIGRSTGSILDRFIALGEGLPPELIDDYEVGPAYDAFALIHNVDDDTYASDLRASDLLDKEFTSRVRGSMNELMFSLAGNLEEKLMFGVTLSMPIVRITEDRIYIDSDDEDQNAVFRSFQFDDFREIDGIGFQLKAGLIYRHSQALRLGLAIHSPGWFSLSEEYYTTATFRFDPTQDPTLPNSPQIAESPVRLFDYNFTSPWRVMAGIGYIVGNNGFLSFDVEYLDYSSSNYNFTRRNSNQFLPEERMINNQLERELGGALNFRVGGELAINTIRLRGGLQYVQRAFDVDDERDLIWSLGAGVRSQGFFLDIAFQRSLLERLELPYFLPENSEADQPGIFNDFGINRIALTMGFKF